MIFKEIKGVFSGYNQTYESMSKLPVDVPWVKYDGILRGKYDSHVYYWTIVPYTYEMKRYIVSEPGFYVDTYVFDDKVLIRLGACEEMPELKIVDWKEIYDKYQLSQYVFVQINEHYQVTSVNRVLEMPHPECGVVHSIGIYSIFKDELWSAIPYEKCDLIDQINNPFHEKAYILSGNHAAKIWNDAFTDFQIKFLNLNAEIGQNTKWNCPEAEELETLNDFVLKPYIYDAIEVFVNQFKKKTSMQLSDVKSKIDSYFDNISPEDFLKTLIEYNCLLVKKNQRVSRPRKTENDD